MVGPYTLFGEEKNILPLPGLEPRFVHPMATSLLPMMSGSSLRYSEMMKLTLKAEGVSRSVRCKAVYEGTLCVCVCVCVCVVI